jgi:flagellar biosynthesis chaperone FliJ
MLVARAEWEVTAKAVRALERLDDRQRATWVLESTRAAQAATDEVAQSHYDRNRG